MVCKFCGSTIEASAKFCGQCGQTVSARVACPHCGEDVAAGKFCGKCGRKLNGVAQDQATPVSWDRGTDVFARKVPETKVRAAKTGFEVRHGTRALFFENGRLVDIADSRRYSKGDSFLSTLFAKKRKLSAVLVDAGDVVLPFSMTGVMTGDNIEVGVNLDVVLRLDDHNRFYVNVMKDRSDFFTRDLRSMLFPEVKNSVQEAITKFSHAQLSPSHTAKEEIASRLENHLRTTFGRIGLDFGQVRAIDFSQDVLDRTAKKTSRKETEARDIEADSRGEFRVERAKQDARALDREIKKSGIDEKRADRALERDDKRGDLDDKRADRTLERDGRQDELDHSKAGIDLKAQEHQINIEGKQVDGRYKLADQKIGNEHNLAGQVEDNNFNLSRQHNNADYISKRIEVYKKLKQAEIGKIKTSEDFRKFQLEIDRDKVLDDAEWQEFEEELLWKGEDRTRERRFLLRKIEMQEQFDQDRLKIVNHSDLTILEKEQKLRQAEKDRDEDKRKLSHEIELAVQRLEAEQKIEKIKAEQEVSIAEIKELSAKKLELEKRLKDIAIQEADGKIHDGELKKEDAAFRQGLSHKDAEVNQELRQEKAKSNLRHDNELQKIEIQRLKSEMGLTNLKRLKAIKRNDRIETELHQMKIERDRFELKEKELRIEIDREAQARKFALDKITTEGQVENDRLARISTLNLEQLISVSGMEQSKVLGELGKSQTLKGMSSEEILAMNDPEALGRALEERAKADGSDEIKAMFEKMQVATDQHAAKSVELVREMADKSAGVHRENAERNERMFNRAMYSMQSARENATSGERRAFSALSESERNAADRTERMAAHSMEQMGGVATAGARFIKGGLGNSAAGGVDGGGQPIKVQICSNCKQEVDSKENFCPNCGNKMY